MTNEQAASRSRVSIVIVLIVALVLGAVTRDWARTIRNRSATNMPTGQAITSSLANMNSFALALLLGGLRGPLVMILWTSSESQKNEKNLEDFDTKVEWIRLLQPEFDTVHIFQVWNKAYNISVQMASLANKYSTILDAIDYAQRVEAGRPNNINMIYAVGGIFFDKLGTSSEKVYYQRRVREESLPHQRRRVEAGSRRTELDPVLDRNGNILPEYLQTKYQRPAKVAEGGEWNIGAELQYLEKYQPFPTGVSTFGLAYNYFKRAEVMQSTLGQKHAQMSELVIDSRPALALKQWGESELERGRQLELKVFGHAVPEERAELEVPTADVAVDATISVEKRADLAAAIESYDRAAGLGPDALVEYQRHLRNDTTNFGTYQSHMAEARAGSTLAAADRDYLRAMLASGEERKKLLSSASENYAKASDELYRLIFKYFIDDELAQIAFPQGIRRTNVDELPSALHDAVLAKVQAASAAREYDGSREDRVPFERMIQRLKARQKRIATAK